jgi:nucleotide-binding universal stress UspA family protein
MFKVIVGYDGSSQAERAVEWAASEAEQRGWPLRIVQSWREPFRGGRMPPEPWRVEADVRLIVDRSLDDARQKVEAGHPAVTVDTVLSDEPPWAAVVGGADADDLVVVGARGQGGFLGLSLGSVSAKVARRSPAPVIVVRGQRSSIEPRIVVGVDGSPWSRAALRFAADEAERSGDHLVVALAWSLLLPAGPVGVDAFRPDYGAAEAERALAAIVADEVEAPGLVVEQVVICDLPARAVLELAVDARLLVVGAHGHGGAGPWDLGSISQQVLLHACGSVAVVRYGDGRR